MADAFENCEPRTPTRVLAAVIFSTLEKHHFDSTTAHAEVTSNFSIMAAQLHKAITGVDYKSGPHVYKKKKRMTTETVTTTSAIEKPAEDTLSSSSDSDPLYNPF